MENVSIFTYVAAAVAAALISFLATPPVRRLAERIGAMDVPKDDRRMHNVPIPRMGGLAIFLGFLISILIFADINAQIRGMLIGAVIIVALGIIDDIVSIGAWPKLAVQIVASVVPVLHGTTIQVLSNPFSSGEYFSLGAFAIPATILWIVVITNSVNLIDGLDGLAVGVSAISSITLVVVALLVAEANVALIMIALAGACLGFMPFNLYPAKIFMGDTGATFLGFILGCMSVQGLFKFYAVISFVIPFLIIGLPIFDTAFSFFRRLLTGKNPMKADRGHVHHKLIDMGLNQKQSVFILYLVTCILGLLAVLLTTTGPIRWLLALVALILVLIVVTQISKRLHMLPHTQGSREAPAPQENKCVDAQEAQRDLNDEKD